VVFLAVLLFLAIFREAAIRTTAPLSEIISGRTIVIDPGHGGPDPGCVAGQAVEKEIVLAIAKKLATRFDRAFMRATLTRESDTDLADPELTGARARKRQDISRRAEAANGGADLLISVHANSFPSPVWSGAQTFTIRSVRNRASWRSRCRTLW
jgi:N-acetylmuramoyl-L-alanine amidase